MAYMIGSEGPYPNLPGEFCGNCYLQEYAIVGGYWNLRVGRPCPTEYRTLAELKQEGIVGMYLMAALPMWNLKRVCPELREVPTPPELTEPVADEGK